MPLLKNKVLHLGVTVPDPKLELPDLRSGLIEPQDTNWYTLDECQERGRLKQANPTDNFGAGLWHRLDIVGECRTTSKRLTNEATKYFEYTLANQSLMFHAL